MKIKKVVAKIYSDKCPICGKEITARSESAMKYNLGNHVDKHKRLGEC